MAKKTEEKERILLFNNFQRRLQVEKNLSDVIYIANNTVIPICKALDMPVTKESVIKWAKNEDEFRDAFVNKCKFEAAGNNKYMSKIIEEAAIDDFNIQLRFYPYPVLRNFSLSDDEAQMLSINRDVMIYDDRKVEELTNVYLTDQKRIEVYHRIEELCKALDRFFGEKMPSNDFVNSWAQLVYPTKDGFKVNPRADFDKYVKK